MEQLTTGSSLQLSEEVTGLLEDLAKMWSPKGEMSPYPHRAFRDISATEKSLIRTYTSQLGERELTLLGTQLFRKFHSTGTSDNLLQMGRVSAPKSEGEFVFAFTCLILDIGRERPKTPTQTFRQKLTDILSGLTHPSRVEG